MDPIRNPFAPGAGTQPPELAGRDELRKLVHVAVQRACANKPSRSLMLTGLRGVGKTVLLDRMREDAEAIGVQTIRVEAPEGRSLPAILLPQLRVALLRLSRIQLAKDAAERALRAVAGFVKALKVKFHDIEVGLDFAPEPGLADAGDLEHDLQELLTVAGEAAHAASTPLVIFIDELQYVEEPELAALITALHRCSQRQLPVLLVGAGLPQLLGRMGNAKSYAERLFEFKTIGALAKADAANAIAKPIQAENAEIQSDALELILTETHGYPYFLQEWGKCSWAAADASPIDLADVRNATDVAVAALDESFFKVRYDRLAPYERRYLRAMAELGPGPHRSGDIAKLLKRAASSFGPVRASLISKGMIWSPAHGDTAFTVPLFDEFMKRAIPGRDWMS